MPATRTSPTLTLSMPHIPRPSTGHGFAPYPLPMPMSIGLGLSGFSSMPIIGIPGIQMPSSYSLPAPVPLPLQSAYGSISSNVMLTEPPPLPINGNPLPVIISTCDADNNESMAPSQRSVNGTASPEPTPGSVDHLPSFPASLACSDNPCRPWTTADFVPPDVTGLSKREARLVKNRAAAFLSRQRKREEFEAMEL
jgi:hypothetical protein